MRKKGILLLELLALSASTVKADSFWLKLKNQNIEVSQTEQKMNTWFSLPADNSFQLVKDRTDRLGYRHQEYQQYVGGVKVKGGIVKVHSLEGHITSANGFVLETPEAPRQARSQVRNGAKTTGQDMVLVKVGEEMRYAYISYDRRTMEDVYTDAETGIVIKRIQRRRSTDALTTGRSLYSGICEFTHDVSDKGIYYLNDNARNIFTLDARHASPDASAYESTDSSEGLDVEKYIRENTAYLGTNDPHWELIRVDSIRIDALDDLNSENERLGITSCYATIQQTFEPHDIHVQECTDLPCTLDITNMQYQVGDFAASGMLVLTYTGKDGDTKVCQIPVAATSPGVYECDLRTENDQVVGHGKYYVSSAPNFAIDVHWGMEQTLDYYKDTLHRDSYDDNGAAVFNVIYPLRDNEEEGPSDPDTSVDFLKLDADNASAVPDVDCPFMIYGLGATYFKPVVSIDVMAHEFTHLVTWATSDLAYEGESGALNESFSDIIGISVKQAVTNAPHEWLIGKGLFLDSEIKAMRSMSDPETYENPGIYKGAYWQDTEDLGEDSGGVHTNSGVQNHWFYLLSEGGEYTTADGSTRSFSGIGTEKAVQIAFRNLTELLTPQSQYTDAVKGSLQAAEEIFGENSVEQTATREAWAAVGLPTKSDDPTSIISISTTPGVDHFIYTISGIRLNRTSPKGLPSGIYIQDGKKIVVR